MMAGRGFVVLIFLLAICLPAGDFALAQEQEEKPETNESQQQETKDEEEGGPQETGHVEKVTVTATRVETELMKTPVAVTVLEQDTLDREGVKDVQDMAQMVPNMDIATINGQSTPIISLRGVRSTNETELGDPSVGVHLDGIYSPRMQGALALMFDNERVEVLRGPQGTLFGRNSTVGNINIITAKPKLDSFAASGSLRFGNYNAREAQAMFNVPVSDKFGFRVAARINKRDSYIDGYWDPNQFDQRLISHLVQDAEVIAPGSLEECTDPRCYTRTQHSNWWAANADGGTEIRELVKADPEDFYMNADEWAYRIGALWKPTEDVSLNLSWQRYRNDSAGGIDLVNCEKLRGRPHYDFEYDDEGNLLGVYQTGTNDCGDMFPKDDTYQAVVNTPGRLFLDINYLRTQLTWDIKEDLRFIYSAGLEDMDRESAQDMEQGLNAWDQAMFFLPGTGSKSWAHEVQLQSYGEKNFNWIAGLNFFHEKTKTIGYFNNAMGEKSLWDQPDRSTDAGALFAQGTYSYSPQWHVTLGYRYSDETKEDRGGETFIFNSGFGCDIEGGDCPRAEYNALPADIFENPSIYGPPSANDNKGSWSHHDFRVGLDYVKNDNTLLYGYLATGFKAGGIGDVFEERNPRTGEFITVRTAFEPEEVTTLELGFKQRLPERNLDLRGNYFYTDYEQMQYASVGAIAFTERWAALRDENGDFIRDDFGNLVFGWVAAPIVAYFTQNVPGAQIQGFEFEYDWRPWTGGRINGYATWLDTEITENWITKWNYDPVSYFGLDYASAADGANPVLQVNLKGNELAVSPRFKLHFTLDHAFLLQKYNMSIVPWVTFHWEDDSYLTIWNVDKHTGNPECPDEDPDGLPDRCLDFVIFPEDIKYTDDKRNAWSMVHAGVRLYRGNWTAELYAYNLTNEVVQWWGGAAEQVAKGSFSMPLNFGFQIGRKF